MSESNQASKKISTSNKIVHIPIPFADVVQARSAKPVFVSAQGPWIPWGNIGQVCYLGFDVRQDITYVILRLNKPGAVGTHHHRGQVILMPLRGSVRYLEYDWVAGPGDFIFERPGEAHTLVSEHPEGVDLYAQLGSIIDFYDENANLVASADVWFWINHYESYCKEQGIPINEELYV